MTSQLWNFLTTDIREIVSVETITEETDAVAAVLDLANVLQEQGKQVKQLAPLVSRISTLLDVLNSPLGEIVGAGLPFVSIGAKLLAFYLEKTQKQPTLEQCVAIASQVAYLESFQEFLKNEHLLNRISKTPVSQPVQQQIKQLEQLELDEKDAETAVVCFHESKLAAAFGRVLSARLENAGLEKQQAECLTQRVAWNTSRYIMEAWAESPEAFKHLGQPSFSEWRAERETYQSIDHYLTEQIAAKPLERVFRENFTFGDLYVPLKAKPIDKNGDVEESAEPFNLETWAREMLLDPDKQDRVLFIQGGPGRGKSVFCRMFADWVRQHLHPIWTPILIRLRDIPKLQPSFRETLRDAVNADFASDEGWLTNRNTRYLFLLDGFDELLMEGRTSGGLEEFLRQVGQFQQDACQGKDLGHRVLVSGRTLALHGIEWQMPDNLERVRIEVMDWEIQQQWLEKWAVQVGREKTSAFEQFLQDDRCPQRVRELGREPLLLYLLAAMHRDGQLQVEEFEGANGTGAKIKIYKQFLDWVLAKQRPEWLQHKLTEQDTEDLHHILSEAGLCVIQSGGELASVKAIESRLKGDEEAKALLEEAQKRLGENPLRNALAAFYLQKGTTEGSVEFAHKSFGEFLCAQRLKESLQDWTVSGQKRKRFYIPEEQLHGEIYDLLGYGPLTPEIVEYLMGLLVANQEFRPVALFERLQDFYLRWCDGEFIDAPPENLPQKKMRQLRDLDVELGQRQVDIYAGLNVAILLLELHRYARQSDKLKEKIAFYPCGELNAEGELKDRTQLFRIMSYSCCIGAVGFLDTVGQFLTGADLKGAILGGAILRGANLGGANLGGAILRGANLRGADLRGANLSDTILSGANLSHADLRGANLRGANLSRANLSEAILSDANLCGTDLSRAILTSAILSDEFFGDIRWDENANWEDVCGLETAVNVPQGLKQQFWARSTQQTSS